MKEKYRAFKEWKKNPRHNALYQLLCWFIFFATLYLLACAGVFSPNYQSSNTNKENNKFTTNTVENYGKMNNYEYEYNINYDNNSIVIKGIVYDSKNYFTINDIEYFDDGNLYLVDHENRKLLMNPTTNIPISLSEISQESIYLWLSGATKIDSLEYKDGTVLVTYLYSPTPEYDIKITSSEKDYLIDSLKIDLLEFLLTKNLHYTNFTIDISYTNINNIYSYEKNYEEYEVIDQNAELNNSETLVEGEV